MRMNRNSSSSMSPRVPLVRDVLEDAVGVPVDPFARGPVPEHHIADGRQVAGRGVDAVGQPGHVVAELGGPVGVQGEDDQPQGGGPTRDLQQVGEHAPGEQERGRPDR